MRFKTLGVVDLFWGGSGGVAAAAAAVPCPARPWVEQPVCSSL